MLITGSLGSSGIQHSLLEQLSLSFVELYAFGTSSRGQVGRNHSFRLLHLYIDSSGTI